MARYLHAVSQILVTALTIIIPFAFADLTTTIDPSSNWGTWEGWGTSLAWWAAAFGTRDDLANIFFTSQTVTLNGVSLPGLGFNIARYNAGVSSWNTINGITKMVVSPKMIPSRQIEGFWMDWASTSPSSSSWNWSADSAQRAMLSKARARGANILEPFSNSPMWWMCKNHNPSSSDDGSSDNLQSWNYQSYAVYMATVAKYFSDTWSTKFSSVDPFNEPTATWWNGKTGTQEGCHFDVSTQATILNHLRTELDSRGLSSTAISASDESYLRPSSQTPCKTWARPPLPRSPASTSTATSTVLAGATPSAAWQHNITRKSGKASTAKATRRATT